MVSIKGQAFVNLPIYYHLSVEGQTVKESQEELWLHESDSEELAYLEFP